MLTPQTGSLSLPLELKAWAPFGSRPMIRKRELYVTEETNNQLDLPWAACEGETAAEAELRRAKMTAQLIRWVSGTSVLLVDDLKPLRPPPSHCWAFRANAPRPGSRLFGFFFAPSVFVGLALARRDLLNKGEDEDRAFEIQMRSALAKWRSIFPAGREPLDTGYLQTASQFSILCGWLK
jgi:hypothetical protein